MKRKIWAAIGAGALLAASFLPALAADTGAVTATVTPQLISVLVDPTSTDYGVMGISEVKKADTTQPNDEFIVTNNGNVAEDFDIIGSDATGGVTWALSPTAIGSDQYMHAYSANKALTGGETVDTDATYNPSLTWVSLNKGGIYKTFAANVGVSATKDLVLEILTPSTVTDSVAKTTTVTVLATEAP